MNGPRPVRVDRIAVDGAPAPPGTSSANTRTMNSRVEHPRSKGTARRAFEVFAICDDEPGRLEGPCRDLPNGRGAALLRFDAAGAIDAAFKGVIDALVVDGSLCSPECLTALSFLHRERPRIRIYIAIEDGGPVPHLAPWESALRFMVVFVPYGLPQDES